MKCKIVIVVDMWLTGFDVPYLDIIYVDKPMKTHILMQAIARVNRVCTGKPGDLVVDYIGIKKNLFEALKTYIIRNQDKVQENEEGKKIALDTVEVIRNVFHYFDYKDFFGDADKRRYELIRDGAEYIQLTYVRQKVFIN
nr:type I restriction enzyme endonuclease domain-containing protein [Clostridium senegalense]